MPSITITRTGKLEKPMGIGEGRITEGIITADWGSARTISAKDVGLRSISNLIVTPGTPLDIEASARVISIGSIGNTARVIAYLKQSATIRLGSGPRYTTYPVSFTGSPDVILTLGSVASFFGSAMVGYLQRQRRGSFAAVGTPTSTNAHYFAVGPGSFRVNYIACGD